MALEQETQGSPLCKTTSLVRLTAFQKLELPSKRRIEHSWHGSIILYEPLLQLFAHL
jgi:hypothetical protein